MTTRAQLYSRQKFCVPRSVYNKDTLVIGCGAVGRNVAVQLGCMGVRKITLYDPDYIEEHNVSSQGFPRGDVGLKKVRSVKKSLYNISNHTNILSRDTKWIPDYSFPHYVFLCADCMTVRDNVSRYFHNRRKKPVIIDTRMAGEDIRIMSTWNRETRKYYEKNMFSNEQASQATCTSNTTIYCAMATASFAIQTMVNHLKRGVLYKDQSYNIGNGLRKFA